jgi:peptidyl-Lys metalloendopeptidase
VAVASCNLFVSVAPALNGAVSFSITNEGVEPAEFLTYGTPFDGETLFFPVLNITTRGGISVPYNGPVARFVYPPPKTATIQLPPGSTLSVLLRASEYYDLPVEDDYVVSIVLPRFNPTLTEARINEEPTTARLVPGTGRKQGTNRAGFTNCSGTQQTQVTTAAGDGLNQSNRAYSCLNGRTCSSLNTRWFGTTVGSTNYNYDVDTFAKVNKYLNNGINAYCNPAGCGPNVYGYVYPTDSTKTVYLCGAFWNVPNERANTIVHEESHFNDGTLRGTDDYTYGEISCLALANSSPSEASHNADNVCFMSAEA